MGQVVQRIPQINKENIMKMKEQKIKWDESMSGQWRFFQENERKEKKNEKKLDIWL